MEMTRFYLQGQRTKLVLPGAGIPLVNNTLVPVATVPAGRCWLVEAVEMIFTPGAVAPNVARLDLFTAAFGVFAHVKEQTFLTASPQTLFLKDPQGLVIMGPGDKVGFTVGGAAATTVVNVFVTLLGLEVLA
jgi:hypothetical protein